MTFFSIMLGKTHTKSCPLTLTKYFHLFIIQISVKMQCGCILKEDCHKKTSGVFPTKSITNRAVQPLRLTSRSMEFRCKKLDNSTSL